jgi:hypothetical protein
MTRTTMSMRAPALIATAFGLAACGRSLLNVGGDLGTTGVELPDGGPTVVQGGGGGPTPVEGKDGGKPLPGKGVDGGSEPGVDGGAEQLDGGSPPLVYVDAGLYYGDGSYFVDGGAYPDLSDASSQGGTDAEAVDAAPGCGPLAACCSSLQSGAQALCSDVVGQGNATNCSTELTLLQGAGDCTGVSTVTSGIAQPASRLASDGTLLFWSDFIDSGGLLAAPVSGGKVTTLLTGIVHLVDVDDANVYVLIAGSLDSFGVGDINTYAMVDVRFVRIPKSGAPPTLISDTGYTVWAATTLAGTAYWMEAEEGTGPASTVAVKSAPLKGGSITSIATLSGGSLATVYSGVTQIGVTNSTVFVGSYHAVETFPLSGGMVSDGPTTLCESFASDTSAVYCDVGTGSNLRIGSDGLSSTLGSVVNPVGSDPFPYIAYDDTYAYWVNNATAGTIMKAPKAGGGTATVLAQDTSPTAIAVDANSVYWSDEAGYIKSIPK